VCCPQLKSTPQLVYTTDLNPITLTVPAIHPAETHPGVILYAIASRDESTAKSQASTYKFQKHYGSYEALLADPDIDFVYISTPNGLHYEWASKAVKGGQIPLYYVLS